MSLYNMVLGHHPLTGPLLNALGYTKETVKEIPRFRDVYLFPNEIRLLTRTGGGNRKEYADENMALTYRKRYLRDWDDEYDSTFAWFAYKWPEDIVDQLQGALEAIQEARPDLLPENLRERFEEAVKNIGEL